MTDKQRNEIKRLRAENYSYNRISEMLSVPLNTVKTYCRRHNLTGNLSEKVVPASADTTKCEMCGVAITQTPGRKLKRFCSDTCRNRWWNSHLDLVKRKANYEYTCPGCGEPFTIYGNARRKYCCHECYIADRFKKGEAL